MVPAELDSLINHLLVAYLYQMPVIFKAFGFTKGTPALIGIVLTAGLVITPYNCVSASTNRSEQFKKLDCIQYSCFAKGSFESVKLNQYISMQQSLILIMEAVSVTLFQLTNFLRTYYKRHCEAQADQFVHRMQQGPFMEKVSYEPLQFQFNLMFYF